MLPALLQTHLALTVETDPRRLGYLRARMLGLVPPCWWRLAGEVLERHANREVARGCDDFDWPEWFPVAQREPLVRALEHYNNPAPERAAEVEESVEMYARHPRRAPGLNWLAGFFAAVLDEVGRED